MPRARRQAAQRATDSFAAALAEQDALLRQEQENPNTKKPSNSSPTNKSKTTKPPKFTATTAGRRLQDGAIVAPRRHKRQRQGDNTTTTTTSDDNDDPSLALLQTLENKSSSAGRLLRRGYRQAVANAYEQNVAVARLAAIPHGLQLRVLQQQRDHDKSTSSSSLLLLLHVTFSKGVQGRGHYEEDVDYLPLEVLQHVVQAIYPVHKQALRPENLALLSPRVLWSLVYHYHQQQDQQADHHGTVHVTHHDFVSHALQHVCPDLDWSFLQRRQYHLSAKARENLRQQQEEQNSKQQEQQHTDWEAAAAAIASVETAMEELATTMDARRVEPAAPERLTWQVVTPTEADEDELASCLDHGPVWETTPCLSRPDLVKRLRQECDIHNWRQLANASVDHVMTQLGLDPSTTQKAHVQAWLEHAQAESLDEIMVEICDGRIPAVQALSESARSATPKDLAAWTWIVDELRQELQRGSRIYREKPDQCPTTRELKTWCQRAQLCMQQLEWTAAFVTPLAE